MTSIGVIAVSILGIGFVILLRKWPSDIGKTFSQNAAEQNSSAIYYGSLLIIFLSLFSYFVLGGLVDKLKLTASFEILFLGGVISQTIAALVPETHGLYLKIHQTFAGIMHLVMPILMVYIGFNSEVSTQARVLAVISVVYMVSVILLAILVRRMAEKALIYQSIYVASFLAVFLLASL